MLIKCARRRDGAARSAPLGAGETGQSDGLSAGITGDEGQNARARLQLRQRLAAHGADELVRELSFPYIT